MRPSIAFCRRRITPVMGLMSSWVKLVHIDISVQTIPLKMFLYMGFCESPSQDFNIYEILFDMMLLILILGKKFSSQMLARKFTHTLRWFLFT